MRKNIHPNYHDIVIEMTDGSQFKTRSTWGKPDALMKLEIDRLKHSAWTGGKTMLLDSGQVEKFKNKYRSMSFED